MKQHNRIKLIEKGSAADIYDNRAHTVSITWKGTADFDVAAVWEDKKGNTGIIYQGDTGNPMIFPHISITEGCCLENTLPNGEETFRICAPFLLKYIWILCWDSEKISKGLPAEFKESSLLVTVMDNKENVFEIHPDIHSPANIVLLAGIDNSRLIEKKIINISYTGIFNELKNLDQLMVFIRDGQKTVPSSIYKFSILGQNG